MKEIKKNILYSKETIEKRVNELAETISRDYEGREIVFVCVLKGAFIFLADLTRQLKVPHVVDFVRLASYGSGTVSSGKITITKDIETSIEGRDVVIVEDIIDTGITMDFLKDRLKKSNPNSLKICALLDKEERREVKVDVDYVGFTIEDKFIVGYGLDFDEKFRCLPDIYVIDE
ncbi:MAG: hypoxanthine phosphoribosyltransferase [Syntrophobacterales bacterium]|nr:hypoxanthine phosphoribosyltransferase [Syntrophobacterales bacterium]